MQNLEIRKIRIIDTPIPDDGSGLMYRENGRFYRVVQEPPTAKPLSEGYRDVEAALIVLKERPCVLFIPVVDAQQIYNEKIAEVLRRNKKGLKKNHGT